MVPDELRALWAEPRAPDPPARGGRDWALLAAGLAAAGLEATLRDGVVWWPVSVLVTVVFCLTTLWRRTHPLPAVAVGFGSATALTLADLLIPAPQPLGLYTGVIVLVLVYALPRWGSGRDVVLGSGIVLTTFVLSLVVDPVPASEQVAAFVFLTFPGVLGASVRFRATSHRRELERVRSREREEFARELHDTVAHHVSAIVIQAQSGRVVAGGDPAAAVRALEGIEEEGARTLEAMRLMVGALRGADAGVPLAPRAGVADLHRLVGRPGGPRIDLRLDGALDALPPAVDAAVHRIAQESVTNALRHAVGATEVVVRVAAEPGAVRVTVQDDGTAGRHGPHRDGYGLTGLRERAAMLGGVVEAGPGPGRGWLVEAELPLGEGGGRGRPRPRR